ncbi:MAG: phosphohistidine phosphatase SixA [Gammaproteobacteria bacterium]
MKKLYLMRHGQTTADTQRQLSPMGIHQVEAAAHKLLQRAVKVDMIYHSGVLRAQQTAEIIAQRLAVPTQYLDHLKADSDIDVVLATLEHWQQDVMLVSHLPFLVLLSQALLPNAKLIEFDPATVACLEFQTDQWQLMWEI